MLATGYVSPDLGAGSRPGATRVPFTVGDRVAAAVDVGSGNLLVTTSDLAVPRLSGQLGFGLVYNSASLLPGSRSVSATMVSPGWSTRLGADVRLVLDSDNSTITYYGPDGRVGVFTPIAANPNTYTSPAGFKMTLTRQSGWTLLDHESGDSTIFNSGGRPIFLDDREGGRSTLTYASGVLSRVDSDAGTTAARRVTVTTSGGKLTGLSQASPAARSVAYGYTSGKLTSITDALSRTTSFGYDGSGRLASITAPGGGVTSISYDTAGRVASITQPTASAAAAVTRFSYSAGQTLVADPNTNQSLPITSVPRTTYAIGAGMFMVNQATDPSGAVRAQTFTPFFDVASATDANGTATAGYDPAVNGGESLTSTSSPTGAGTSATYANPAGPSQYQPNSVTNAQGSTSLFTYSGAGNPASSSDAMAATASITYNTNRTIATATDPSGAVTSYGYDANGQLTSITPPAGNSLGARAFSYDAFGRLGTFTSGRGVIETYSYDAADRITGVAYSGTRSGSIAYTYTPAGYLSTRVDVSGTTTWTYDPVGRTASRVHTAFGGTFAYTYDKAGNIATESNPGGTTSYTYDTRSLVTRIIDHSGRTIDFAHDATGRRTDTWFATNTAHTTFAMHTHTDYDASNRVTRVWSARASNDATRVSDLSYSYASPGPAACANAPTLGADTGIRWAQTDNITGLVSSYCYDKGNRLLSATTPGGDNYAYTYDVNGNLTQSVKNGATVFAVTVNSANQISSTGYTYDAAGNLRTDPALGTITVSGTEQMTSRNSTAGNATYVYAGDDQTELIASSLNASSTPARQMAYGRTDANGLPILEALQWFTSGMSYFTHDPSGTPLAFHSHTGQTHYYALDGLGSAVTLVNHSGLVSATYAYDPYGKITVGAPAGGSAAEINPYRYAGGIVDASAGSTLIKFGHRWYDTTLGRFTQQDSLEFLNDPTRANRYAYAGDNPINNIDPTGLVDCDAAAAGAGFLGAVVGGLFGAFSGAAAGPVGSAVGAVSGAISGARNAAEFTGAACESDSDEPIDRIGDGIEAVIYP